MAISHQPHFYMYWTLNKNIVSLHRHRTKLIQPQYRVLLSSHYSSDVHRLGSKQITQNWLTFSLTSAQKRMLRYSNLQISGIKEGKVEGMGTIGLPTNNIAYSAFFSLSAISLSFSFNSPVWNRTNQSVSSTAPPSDTEWRQVYLVHVKNNIWSSNELSLDEYLRKCRPMAAWKIWIRRRFMIKQMQSSLLASFVSSLC